MVGQPSDSSRQVAERADFDVYELVDPMPDRRRAGGYGFSNRRVSNLEMGFAVDGQEVLIETKRDQHQLSAGGWLRHLATHLILHKIAARDPLELPLSLTLEPADLGIAVDGVLRRFAGIALEDRWKGVAIVTSDIAIEIETPRVLVPRALVACQNFDVDDMAPPELRER